MIKFNDEIKKALLDLYETKKIGLEGNIIRLIDADNDQKFKKYLDECYAKDKEVRKKRLEITKQIQSQNKELSELNTDNEKIMRELQNSLNNIEVSKSQIELQNKELLAWKEDNERISKDLVEEMKKSELARVDAENAKTNAENDLDVLQKKNQYELINMIVIIALIVIVSVGLITTILYIISIYTNKDTQMIGSTWSNMFGILLTNAFSIVGTIMGVKYASEKKE